MTPEEARAKLHERLATEKELFTKLKAVREEFQSFTDLGRSLKPKEIVQLEMRRLKPQAPIIMLSGAVDVPEQALKWVYAFIAKDRLASQLLPAIAQLHGFGSTSPPSCDA